MKRMIAAIGAALMITILAIAFTPRIGSSADLDSARQMFGELCSRCHGPNGYGDGPDGQTLATRPRNFHDCALLAKDTDDLMFQEIKGGSNSIGRSNDMPAWGESLTDDEIRNLVLFLRTFCQQDQAKQSSHP